MRACVKAVALVLGKESSLRRSSRFGLFSVQISLRDAFDFRKLNDKKKLSQNEYHLGY